MAYQRVMFPHDKQDDDAIPRRTPVARVSCESIVGTRDVAQELHNNAGNSSEVEPERVESRNCATR